MVAQSGTGILGGTAYSAGQMYLLSSDLEMTWEEDWRNQMVGLRFRPISVSPGATIVSAAVEFTLDYQDYVSNVYASRAGLDVSLTLAGQNSTSGNAAAFTTTPYDLTLRSYFASTVPWDITEEWTGTSLGDGKYRTPDISSIIQAIVDGPGWASGNALVLKITGNYSNPSVGTRNAYACTASACQNAPKLILEVAV